MNDFRVGEWVECIDTRNEPGFVLGQRYLVELVRKHNNDTILHLKGVKVPADSVGIYADWFRPADPPDT